MAKETLQPAPREIKFGGEGKAEDIKRGFAITTLRNPRPSYDFKKEEVILADCFDDKEKIPVVVITNEIKKLKDFSIPQLALDGFFSARQAAKEMRSWPGYEKTTVNTKMQAITFLAETSYDYLPNAYKWNFKNRDFDNLIHHKELRRLFFPTMCFHLTNLGGNFKTWVDFLDANRIVTEKQIQLMKSYKGEDPSIIDLVHESPVMHATSLTSENPYFKALILGIFDDIY